MDLLWLFVGLLTAHHLADFEAQTDAMATGKSKSFHILGLHVTIYTLIMTAGIFTLVTWMTGGMPGLGVLLKFFLITWATHFVTDAVTSRITSRLWFFDYFPATDTFRVKIPNTRHRFFCMIGLDQLVHAWTLAGTVFYLFG